MDRYLSENLLDGEKILWKGRSEPFRLLAPPYSRSLPLLWTACLSLLTFFAFVFIPFAQQMRVHALQFVLCLMLVILTPLSLCIHSIIDKNIIEKHMVYIFTNYRAISQTPREIRSMLITPATPYRLEVLPDGNEILNIGDACKTNAYMSRANTVTGIHGDTTDQNKITGLVFYGLRNTSELLRQFTPFPLV